MTRQSILTVPPKSWVFRPSAEFEAQANLGKYTACKEARAPAVKRPDPKAVQISGFTLLELLVVAAVLAVLAAVTLTAVRGHRQQAALAQARGELAVLAQVLEDYQRLYGDYPRTGAWAQAEPIIDPAQPIQGATAQAKLCNALGGLYGPAALGVNDRRAGRRLLDPVRLTLEIPGALPEISPGAAVPGEVANALLDPWGRRYLYFYKAAGQAGATPWKTATYALFSAGPDGRYAVPADWDGCGTTALADTRIEGEPVNADNVYATHD